MADRKLKQLAAQKQEQQHYYSDGYVCPTNKNICFATLDSLVPSFDEKVSMKTSQGNLVNLSQANLVTGGCSNLPPSFQNHLRGWR